MIINSQGGENLVMANQNHPQVLKAHPTGYTDLYYRAIDTIRCHPYLDDSGSLNLSSQGSHL